MFDETSGDMFDKIERANLNELHLRYDKSSGLCAIIAIHNTRLGSVPGRHSERRNHSTIALGSALTELFEGSKAGNASPEQVSSRLAESLLFGCGMKFCCSCV